MQSFFKCSLRTGAAVAGEFVGLGCDNDKTAASVFEKFDELHVGRLRRDVAVDEAEAEGERGAFGEIRLNEFGPLGGDGF